MARGIKTGGRQRGTPNKFTRSFRHAVLLAFEAVGGHAAFAAWARENPTEFYRIAARLIPTEIVARQETAVLHLAFGAACHGSALVETRGNGGAASLIEHRPA